MSTHEDRSSDGWIGRPNVRMLAVASATLLLSTLLWFNYSAVLPAVVEDGGTERFRPVLSTGPSRPDTFSV